MKAARVNNYLNEENKGLHKVVEYYRGMIGLKSSWKVLVFRDKSEESLSWMQILNSIKFQSIRHDNDLHADNKKCAKKILKVMICNCGGYEKTFINKALQEYA